MPTYSLLLYISNRYMFPIYVGICYKYIHTYVCMLYSSVNTFVHRGRFRCVVKKKTLFGLRSVRQPLTNIKQFKWLLDFVGGLKEMWGESRHRNTVKKPEKQAYHLA